MEQLGELLGWVVNEQWGANLRLKLAQRFNGQAAVLP